ncbi:MAG: M56 family metallopeptidase, partial [Saprospiraceae bacterium]
MNPLASLAPFAQAFGWAVVHSLWQIALIWLVFKLLEWRLSRRHQAVYLLSLAAMFVSAIWAAVTFAGEFARATLAAQEIFLTENLPSQAVLNLENTVGSFEAALSPTLLETAQIWLETHSAQIGWAWLACAALLWLRLIGGWWLAQRLRHRNVSPAAEAFQSLCDGWAKRLRINPKIELLESPHISEPLTLGFWKPVVLFPVGMLLQLSPAQVEALLVHELAHVRRHDYLLNLFQLALEVCFFYHPLFWLLSREARSRREFCCDEVVMRHTPDPILYARTLTDLQLSFLHPSTQFVMNATGKSRFTERILHIAGISPKRSARPNFLLALLLPLAIGLSSWWPSAKNLPSDESSVSMEMLATDSLPPQKTAQPNPKIARPREMAKPAQPKDKVFSDHPVLETEQPTDRPNTVAMEAVKMNVLYIGVDNPLRVAVSGVPANELQVQLIGKGSMTGSDGNYNVRVVEPGEVTV